MGDIAKSWWVCPAAGCGHEIRVSVVDPDASFDSMLDHIHENHPTVDQNPDVLVPSIEVVEHA